MLRRENILMAPGYQPLLRQHGLDTVESVFRLPTGDVITHSGSTEVRRLVLASAGGVQTLFIKKYWVNRPSQLWSGMFRGTFFGCPKVRREFHNLELLRAAGLDAPPAVAFGEERHAGWLTRSFLISATVADPMALNIFVRDGLPTLPKEEQRRVRRELIQNLALYTRRLHERRFVHHDYFWRNILLSGRSLEHFFLIDAHKGRVWHRMGENHARASDLAALDAPAPHFFRRTERLRFYLRYRDRPRLTADDKMLLRRTLGMAAPMRVKQLRRVMNTSPTLTK